MGLSSRMQQCYLLFGTRVVVQGARLAWVPLLVYVSAELKMGTLGTGSVMSSFSLGYLSTQVIGGVMADRYGGKPVQSLTIGVMALGMLAAPAVADSFGPSGLWVVYFHMGLCAGPQHPAYNSMVAAWFPQDELGKVSSICEAGPVAGNLLALVVGPAVAATYGWRRSFVVFGLASLAWLGVWHTFARSVPDGADEDEEGQAAPDSPGGRSPSSKSLPWGMARFRSVWAVMIQHMCFNGTKYFFADWMPIYFATIFGKQPQRSWTFLMIPELAGMISQFSIGRLERAALQRGLSLLESRRWFGVIGFVGTAFTIFNLALCQEPSSVSLWLCVLQACLAMHSCGYKVNYLDITQVHQGFFMGAGNTLASVMTFLVPISVAMVLEKTHRHWWYVFDALILLNLMGAGVAQYLTAVKRIDEELMGAEPQPQLYELASVISPDNPDTGLSSRRSGSVDNLTSLHRRVESE